MAEKEDVTGPKVVIVEVPVIREVRQRHDADLFQRTVVILQICTVILLARVLFEVVVRHF